jgi:rhodanese-related sulfurtransferase
MLKEKGYENVAAMLGGWNAWSAAGYPMEKGK